VILFHVPSLGVVVQGLKARGMPSLDVLILNGIFQGFGGECPIVSNYVAGPLRQKAYTFGMLLSGVQVLVVDDDPDIQALLRLHLEAVGATVTVAGTVAEALRAVQAQPPSVVLQDVVLPDGSGINVVHALRKLPHAPPIIMVSSSAETQHIVEAIQAGASDYVRKPVDIPMLCDKIRAVVVPLADASPHTESFLMRRVMRDVHAMAESDGTALLRGETGTGKSMIAKMIHDLSARAAKPFVTVNCAEIPATLIESELFGHERGAFTGALKDKIGKFELADGGTIFLDEIGDLSFELQAKLLRVLQGREFERVGSVQTRKVDVRIISATHQDLERAIEENHFREDLYYRLNVLSTTVPPLRERFEDIPVLTSHFLKLHSERMHRHYNSLTSGVLQHLMQHRWPGNVRELQNVIERAVAMGTPPQLTISDFQIQSRAANAQIGESKPESLGEMEMQELISALKNAHGNVSRAAATLGLSRDTVYRRMKRHGIGLKKKRRVYEGSSSEK
jgi:DNA-binding NtrC family response regulator